MEEILTRQKQAPEMFYRTGDLKSFAKFAEKQLYQSLFFNKLGDVCLETQTNRSQWFKKL